MRRLSTLLIVGVLVSGTLLLTATAGASSVRPSDGTYTGVLHSGVIKSISLKVSGHGKTAVLSLSCDGAPIPYHPLRMSIVHGAFHARHQLAPGLSWGISGRFSTHTRASAHFNGQGVCDGRSGNVTLTGHSGPPLPTTGPNSLRPTDGTYKGTLTNGVVKVISLTVSQQGTTAMLSMMCNGTPLPYSPLSMTITNGAFHVSHELAPGLTWGIAGQFSTPTTATAQFNGQGVCDGRSGTVALGP